MWTPEYFVRLLDLPPSVEGVTVPNDDGTFDIYINSLLSEERQHEKLAHELEHIRKDHFYNDIKTVREVEAEANGKAIPASEPQPTPAAEPLPIPKEGEPLPLPLFLSLDSLRKYILWRDYRHGYLEELNGLLTPAEREAALQSSSFS